MRRIFYNLFILFLLIQLSINKAITFENSLEEIVKQIAKENNTSFSPIKNRYAQEFTIFVSANKKIKIIFTKSKNKREHEYVMINGPIKKVILMSTSHIPPIEFLGELDSVVGFSNLRFINNDNFKKKKTETLEIDFPPNVEKILKLNPELLFAYSTSTPDIDGISAIAKVGIKVVQVSEFLETTPLARAEWLVFWGAIYNKLEMAQNKFAEIESKYLQMKAIATQQANRPVVIVGNIQNNMWVAPGGESDFAQLLRDAGAEYLFANYQGSSPIALAPEEILKKQKSLSFWMPQNSWKFYFELKEENFYKILLNQNQIKIFNSTKIVNNGAEMIIMKRP